MFNLPHRALRCGFEAGSNTRGSEIYIIGNEAIILVWVAQEKHAADRLLFCGNTASGPAGRERQLVRLRLHAVVEVVWMDQS